ncbi:hypothetical protein HPB50_013254 [Hyalomma asiaticum]|uniref:Uncharacterized protein n=1 Tax=Hyalomma asiaticum TaxID=266040 RepID=A0ACB7THX6_HYAAI|nr:hypothetical protein HPB50_013254 [Hyalomma asiaticum]
MDRKLKTALDLLRPHLPTTVMSKQISQSLLVSRGSAGVVATPPETFVYTRSFCPCPAWVPSQPEYSGSLHKNPARVSSVDPAVPLDNGGAAAATSRGHPYHCNYGSFVW